jgi:hypothetical protein
MPTFQTTRRYKPEDSHLRTHRRENLKSYSLELFYEVMTQDGKDNSMFSPYSRVAPTKIQFAGDMKYH